MSESVQRTAEDEEVAVWLNGKGLAKYASLLNLNGYKRFTDCVGLTGAKLRELGVKDDRELQILVILGKQRRVPLPATSSSSQLSNKPITSSASLDKSTNAAEPSAGDASITLSASENQECSDRDRTSPDITHATTETIEMPLSFVASGEASETPNSPDSEAVIRSGNDRQAHRTAGDTKSLIRVDPLQIAFEPTAAPHVVNNENVAALEVGPLVMMKPKLSTDDTVGMIVPQSPRPGPVSSATDLSSMASPNVDIPKVDGEVNKADLPLKDGSRRQAVLISVPGHAKDVTPKHNVLIKVSDRTPRDEFSLEYRERCLLPVNMQIRTLGLQDNASKSARRMGTVRVIRASVIDDFPDTNASLVSTVITPSPMASAGVSKTNANASQQSPMLLAPPLPSRKIAESEDESDYDEIDSPSHRPKITPPTSGSDSVGDGGNHAKMLSGYLILLPATLVESGTFWAVFDGTALRLFKNDRARVSKRVIPVRIIEKAVALTIDRNRFALMTSSGQFPFDLPKGEENKRWFESIDAAVRSKSQLPPSVTIGQETMRIKEGWLTIERDKKRSFLASSARTRKYAVICNGILQLYRSNEERRTECPIHEIRMELAAVKLVMNASNKVDHTKLQLVDANSLTPYILCFDNSSECEEWNKALQHAILVALDKMGSTDDSGLSKTLSKIYENPSNRFCADCGASDPEWASINLGIMICDRCAGCHRQLSVSYSKVQSVRLDTRIWTNTTIMIMTTIGNGNANKFWEGSLPGDFVRSAWTVDDGKRNEFVRNKYVEKRYCAFHSMRGDVRRLSEELCDVIRNNDRTLIEAMELFFSGASLSYESVEGGVPINVMQLAVEKKRFLLSEFFANNQNVVTATGSLPPAAHSADNKH